MEGARSPATSLVAYQGEPRLWHSGHLKDVSPGSQEFDIVMLTIWVELLRKWFWLVLGWDYLPKQGGHNVCSSISRPDAAHIV